MWTGISSKKMERQPGETAKVSGKRPCRCARGPRVLGVGLKVLRV